MKPIFQTAAGPLEICTVFDFVKLCRKETVSSVYKSIAVMKKEAYSHARYVPYDLSESIAQTQHLLKLNPMSLLVELKRTTTKKYRQAKVVDFEEMVNEIATDSLIENGAPTHFFNVGQDLYCLACVDDFVLFTTEEWKQQLVCVSPHRNFTVHAPNLKMRRY